MPKDRESAPKALMRDVAKEAGVSMATVSNALNNPSLVAPGTLARVRRAIEKLGYEHVRRTSAELAAITVHFVASDLSDGTCWREIGEASRAAAEQGMTLLAAGAAMDGHRQTLLLEKLMTVGAGALVAPIPGTEGQVTALARGSRIVALNCYVGMDVCSVAMDEEDAGNKAAKHLIAGGYRNIVLVDPKAAPQPWRLGVERAVTPATGAILGKHPVSDGSIGEARYLGGWLPSMLGADERRVGVVAPNDKFAAELVRALHSRHDVRVPEDIGVIGHGDERDAVDCVIPLSTISVPAGLIGRAAVNLLVEELAGGPHAHQQQLFEPTLIVRASTTAS